ncbi:MAG: hypothetical protein NC936_05620, partial [Candidatus Omnitrophica bacterium]|nr:hypothetical protein [Candidatus Omnitrophota bacterium]
MHTDNIFKVALLVSLGIHSFILAAMPFIKNLSLHKKIDAIEIVYLKPPTTSEIKKIELSKNVNRDVSNPPSHRKEDVFKEKEMDLKKPEIKLIDIDSNFSKDKITFLAIDSGKVDNPNYLNYYQTIRERIKRAAYQIYSRRDKGEVYVSF